MTHSFAIRLRQLISDRGLTLRKLGQLSGINAQNLPAYIDGSISPRIDTVIALAAALTAAPAWLAFGQEVDPTTQPDPAVFADNLRVFRKARGLTQVELAARSDLSSITVSAYERAERQPSVQQAIVLADVLGVAPALLTLGQNPVGVGSPQGRAPKWTTDRKHRDRVALTVMSRLSFSAGTAVALQIPAGDLCSLLKLEATEENHAYAEKLWEEMTSYFPVFVRRLAGKLSEEN